MGEASSLIHQSGTIDTQYHETPTLKEELESMFKRNTITDQGNAINAEGNINKSTIGGSS
jgi:hypothetical protein